MSGTSGAAPQVAGLAGLILSVNPDLTSDEVQEIIQFTADDLGPEGWDAEYGWGKINVLEAFVEASYLILDKVDDVALFDPNEMVDAGDYVTYTLSVSNPFTDENDPKYIGLVEDVEVVDYLPDGIDVDDITVSTSYGGYYDPNTHTARWTIPKLKPGADPNEMSVTVRITEEAEPLGELVNIAEIIDAPPYSFAVEVTPIGRWNRIVYVDEDTKKWNSGNNGTSWDKAYPDIMDAYAWARRGQDDVDEIWVAEGVYGPITDPNLNGFAIYGGFDPNHYATEWDERDWLKYQTILSGRINRFSKYDKVVFLQDANEATILDGFTIIGGVHGLYCDGGSPTIRHNRIEQNDYGIYCLDTDMPIIMNNWIYLNDIGLYIKSADASTIVFNNTITYNYDTGVEKYGGSADPNIINCIVWGNEDYQLVGCSATYSCTDYDPKFVLPDANDFHLKSDSDCIDAGNPNGYYYGLTDIDGHLRVMDGDGNPNTLIIDIGADEAPCGDCDQMANLADFNHDGLVNLLDYAELADAWMNVPPGLDPEFDLYPNNIVNVDDLYGFSDEWLWQACWYETAQTMGMSGGGGERGSASEKDVGQSTESQTIQPETYEQDLAELIKWILEFKPDGWEEFLKILIGY